MNRTALRLFFVLLLAALLPACATLRGEMDPPGISLESLRFAPTESGAPRFEVKLRVINPNKQALDIAGIAYSIEIMGKELILGVSDDIPRIEPYGEQVVTLEAGLQLVGIVRLMASLGTTPTEALDYKFSAKIDFEGFLPTQRIEETGTVNLSQAR